MFDYDDIKRQESILARKILDSMYPNEHFEDPIREEKSLKDIQWTLQFIVEGFKVNNIAIVENLLQWFGTLFKGLQIDTANVELLYKKTCQVLHDEYEDEPLDRFLSRISFPLSEPKRLVDSANPYMAEMENYLDAMLHSERLKAMDIVHELVEKNVPIQDIYIYIFQEAMRRVGELWHIGSISIGREHYCTVVTQYIMSTLYSNIFSSDKKNKKILACAVGSELHEMGIRMVADMFELDGWDTNYLGPNLPATEIVEYAVRYQPDIIALSVTMPYHISKLQETIQVIRNDQRLQEVKVLVGGLPFINNEILADSLEADGYALNAIEGIKIANQLL